MQFIKKKNKTSIVQLYSKLEKKVYSEVNCSINTDYVIKIIKRAK